MSKPEMCVDCRHSLKAHNDPMVAACKECVKKKVKVPCVTFRYRIRHFPSMVGMKGKS